MNKVMGQVIIEIFVTHWLCVRGQNQRVWVFNSVVVAQDKTKKHLSLHILTNQL